MKERVVDVVGRVVLDDDDVADVDKTIALCADDYAIIASLPVVTVALS